MYILIKLVLRHCTLCFSISKCFLAASHLCATKSDSSLHRPEVINLSYVGLGMFAQVLDINPSLLFLYGLCLFDFGQQLS